MPIKVQSRLTPVSPSQFLKEAESVWLEVMGTEPRKESLLVLLSYATSTEKLGYVRNYNFGNVKASSGDGFDYTYVAYSEEMDSGVAAAYAAKANGDKPAAVQWMANERALVWFYPEHPACRFRAFVVLKNPGEVDEHASLRLGIKAFILEVMGNLPLSWEAVVAGDPVRFVSGLEEEARLPDAQKYMTKFIKLFQELQQLS